MLEKSTISKNISKTKYFNILPDFKQKNTQKFYAVVLTLIALSFFGLFAINPTLSTIAKLNKQIEDNEFVYAQLEKKISDLNNLRVQYDAIANDLPFIIDALPKDPDFALLTAQIQSIGQASNVRIKKLQNFQVEIFKKDQESKKYYSYSFSILGSGAYEDIAKFIGLLSNMQRVVNIEVLNIDKPTTATSDSLNLDIKAVAFFKK